MGSENGRKLCFVCCKRVYPHDQPLRGEVAGDGGGGSESSSSFSSSSSSTIYLKFVEFAKSYLQLETSEMDSDQDDSTKVEVFCESCSAQVIQIFGLYEQLCKAEHRLSSKVLELGTLLKESLGHAGTIGVGKSGIKQLIIAKCLEKGDKMLETGCVKRGNLTYPDKGFFADDEDEHDYVQIDVDVKIEEGDSANEEEEEVEGSAKEKAVIDSADEEEVEVVGEELSMKQTDDPLSSFASPKTTSDFIYVAMSDEDSNSIYVPDSQSECDDSDDDDDSKSNRSSVPDSQGECDDSDDDDDSKSKRSFVPDLHTKCNDTDDNISHRENTKRKRIVLSDVVKLMCNKVIQENELLESQAPETIQAQTHDQDQLNFSAAISKLSAADVKDNTKDKVPDNISYENFACDHCPSHFNAAQDLYTHLVWHENQSTGQGTSCPFCYKKFVLPQTQKLHMQIHHPSITAIDKPFTCDGKRCAVSFKTLAELNKHISKHSEDILLECSICQWGFIDSHHLKLHEILHTEPKNGEYHCTACKCRFQRVKELQIHFNFKHGLSVGLQLINTEVHVEKPKIVQKHKCRHCEEDIPIEEDLTLHSQKCGMNPKNVIHVKNKSGNIVKRVNCHKCNILIGKNTIRNHLIVHLVKEKMEREREMEKHSSSESSCDEEGEKEPEIISTSNYTCNQCQREFPQAQGLHIHLLWHDKQSGKQGTPCCFCFRTIVLAQTKQVHMQVLHPSIFNTEKPFACDEKGCEASFKTLPKLNEHVATHSKPISNCSFCHWAFLNPNHLKLHEVVHTKRNKKGEYECQNCKCKYPTVKDLQNHFDFKHGSRLATEVYKCRKCPRHFRTKSFLNSHIKIKHQNKRTEKKHQCLHCKVAFRLEQTLATHLKTCTKNPDNFIRAKTKSGRNTKKFRCAQCGIYVFRNSMRSHLLTHMDETEKEKAKITFTCDICGNSYGSYHILNKHVDRVHKNIPRKKYNCEFCGITYKTRLSMNRHIDIFHKGIDPKVACNLCGKVLSNSSVLYVHMQSHKEVKKYGCHLCEVKYRNKKSLKYHLVKFHGKHVGEEFTPGEGPSLPQQNDGEKMEQQSEETPWKCDACGIFCSSETLLKRHMDILHRKPKPRVVCQFCGKSYSGHWVLKEHIDVVHKGMDLSVVCDVCGRVLSSPTQLKKHMKVHGERKIYACHLCDVTVLSNKYLKKHLVNMHAKAVGEEFTPGEGLKFGCMFSSCGEKFGTDVELHQHVERNHAPVVDSKFMCTLCGKVFSNQARLTRHNLVHSKEKRLECHVCKKRFAYNSSLKDHLKVVHGLGEGQQYFRCEQPNCEAKFKLIKYLNKHVRDAHGVRKDIGNIKTETVIG